MDSSDKYLEEAAKWVKQNKDKHKWRTNHMIAGFFEEQLNEKIEEIERSLRNLQRKHDRFLGTEGQKARTDFKLGLSWGIESLKNAISTLKEAKQTK